MSKVEETKDEAKGFVKKNWMYFAVGVVVFIGLAVAFGSTESIGTTLP